MKKIIAFSSLFLASAFSQAGTAEGTINWVKLDAMTQVVTVEVNDANVSAPCLAVESGSGYHNDFQMLPSNPSYDKVYETLVQAQIDGVTVKISGDCAQPFGAPSWVPSLYNSIDSIELR